MGALAFRFKRRRDSRRIRVAASSSLTTWGGEWAVGKGRSYIENAPEFSVVVLGIEGS